MRILLISPNREVSPDLVFPLGLAYLTAALRSKGITVQATDLGLSADWEHILSRDLEAFRPNCIGLSIRNLDNVSFPRSVTYLPFVKQVVQLCRRKTGVPIIAGGSGFTLMPERVLDYLELDYGIAGEGEKTLVDLLRTLSDAPVEKGSEKERRCLAGRAVDLNTLPDPDRDLLDADSYRKRGALANVQTKRGCPFDCLYCTYPLIEGRTVRVREPAAVIREIKKLAARGLDYLFFVDNNFNFPADQAEGICRELVREKVSVRWTAYVNPGFMTDRLGAVFQASGCSALEFGLDSASPTQLIRLGKNFTVRQIRESARICREGAIPFCFSLLLGGPGETVETVEETLARVEELDPTAVICMTGIRVFPGTQLEAVAREEGMLPPDWNPLEPAFYLAPAVRDALEERLRRFSEEHHHWVFPGLGIDRLPGEISRLHQWGFTGPLWTYLRPQKRKRRGTP